MNVKRLVALNIIVLILLVGGGFAAYYYVNEATNYIKTDTPASTARSSPSLRRCPGS